MKQSSQLRHTLGGGGKETLGKGKSRPGNRGGAALGLGMEAGACRVSEVQDGRCRKGTITEPWGRDWAKQNKGQTLRAGRTAQAKSKVNIEHVYGK